MLFGLTKMLRTIFPETTFSGLLSHEDRAPPPPEKIYSLSAVLACFIKYRSCCMLINLQGRRSTAEF